MTHLQNLDGLRGIAALGVYAVHASYLSMFPIPMNLDAGQLFVMLFFLLSAFLMASLYLFKPFSMQAASRYSVSRLTRILPLYLATIACMTIVSLYFYQDYCFAFDSPLRVVAAVLMVNAPCYYWTIPIEMQFYALLLILWPLYHRVNLLFWCVAALLVSVIPSALLWVLFASTLETVFWYIHIFLLGIAIAVFSKQLLASSHWLKRLAKTLLVVVLIVFGFKVGLDYIDTAPVDRAGFYTRNWWDLGAVLIAASLVFFAVLAPPQRWFLASPPLRALGKISFGFYLIHYPILLAFSHGLESLCLRTLLPLVTSLLLAGFLYRYFEKPLMVLFRSEKQLANGDSRFSE